MRLLAASSIVLLSFVPAAMADLIPYDPHVLLASGGDATPISSTLPIVFSQGGGGIFVFENDTGADLAKFEADIAVPNTFAAGGFGVSGTIFVPPGAGQQASFSATFVPGSDCVGASADSFCEKLVFALVPGPLIVKGQNFVLDFDDPGPTGYEGVDALVATGQYTGDTDTSQDRSGAWPMMAKGLVTPFVATPEPRFYAGLLAALMALGIYARSRRTATAR